MRRFIQFMVLALLISGCASKKEVTYLQGIPANYQEKIVESYNITIQPNDLVSIVVSSRDPELSQMFNLSMANFYVGSESATGQSRVLGYLVSDEGNIDFPQLGILHIAGMTRIELTEYIKDQLVSKGLINDPVVTVQFLNFQVSVMGEVARPGTFSVANDRITIFDALSRAGDMTIYGLRDKVTVIREQDGERTIAKVDLRDDSILSSPYYYLQQNDVVYVEPNKAKAGQREINSNRSIGIILSALSVVISIVTMSVSLAN